LTVLEYERTFQNLSAFASIYLPSEHHRVERFCDGLRQELRMVLIAMQFQSIRELVRATKGMERVIRDAPKQWSSRVRQLELKGENSSGRPPLPKKGKSGKSSEQFQRRGDAI
jgi:hypothetical protein